MSSRSASAASPASNKPPSNGPEAPFAEPPVVDNPVTEPPIIEAPAELRERVRAWRAAGERIALVPTMGDLHAGHLTLIDAARACATRVVASVFVNPLQFGPGEDYADYPRRLEHDAARLGEHGAAVVFAPAAETLYPRGAGATARIRVPDLEDILCGAERPGHFAGVATVVAKLLNIAEPDIALFGQKDYQQLLLIRRLVGDLDFPVEVEGVPTVRESDGLALSSRNGYLRAEERRTAPALYAALCGVARRLGRGERDYARLEADARDELAQAGLVPGYVAVRRADDLSVPGTDAPLDVLRVLAAARLGRARLIDNIAATEVEWRDMPD